jgi:predicted nucleotide-binding protein (sugar kinase/HSP70/actin superfamily)
LWKTFFEDLGAEVVTSEETNRVRWFREFRTAVDEACLPIKVFYGHVHELCRKDIDYLFVPRLVSIEPKSYICPKFMGIPDMIRAGFPNLPELIDITVDVSQSDKYLKRDIVKVGMMLGGSKKNILQAYQHGRMELKRCQELCRMGYSLWEAIKLWEGQEIKLARDYDLTIWRSGAWLLLIMTGP